MNRSLFTEDNPCTYIDTMIIQISNNLNVQLDLYDPFSVKQALSCVLGELFARMLAGLSIRVFKC